MTAQTMQAKRPSGFRISKRVLPYVLSLPALLVCIGILQPALAQEEAKLQGPPELSELKNHYDDETVAATQAIRDRYIASLQALLRSANDRGDSQGVLAVQKELDSVLRVGSAGVPAGLLGTWLFQTANWSGARTFKANGTLLLEGGRPAVWRSDGQQIIITYSAGGTNVFFLPITPEGMMNGRTGSGQEIKAVRE